MHGYTQAIWLGFGIIAFAGLMALLLINTKISRPAPVSDDASPDEAVPVMAH